MQESRVICNRCQNYGYWDPVQCVSYCRSKTCNGLVIEYGKITYENEVNLHENDDQSRKQTRFGGYENKLEAFKSKLCEMMEYSDNKARKNFYEKFEQGEKTITDLSYYLNQPESITKKAIGKYRELLHDHIQDLQKKNFSAVAAIAYDLVLIEQRKVIKDDKRLNLINLDLIASKARLNISLISQASAALKIQSIQKPQADIGELAVERSKEYHFTAEEQQAIREIPKRLMDSSIIKGEKPSTIICVVLYLVSQLCSGDRYNNLTLEMLAAANDVTKETVKKLWNPIIDSGLTNNQIPDWYGRKPLSELKTVQ